MEMKFNKHVYRYLVVLVLTILILGTVVYHLVEHFSWLDSYYFSVVTLATVGYGDFTPHTAFGKIFTTFYVFAGVGIVTTFITYTVRRRAVKYSERQEKKTKL
jgi:voltage-gated potassium channel